MMGRKGFSPATVVVRLVGLATVLAIALPPSPARAQLEPIRVIRQSVENRFPDGLVFSLDVASSEADISSINLLVHTPGDDLVNRQRLDFEPARQVQVTTDPWQWEVGAPVEYTWEIRDGAGNTLATEPATADYLDTRFAWRQIGNDRMTLYWYDSGRTRVEQLSRLLDQAARKLEMDWDVTLRRPIRIWLYASDQDYRGSYQYLRDWVAGTANPATGVIRANLPAGMPVDQAADLLAHEVTHIYYHEITDNPFVMPPNWLTEGVAVYYEPRQHDYENELVARAAASGDLPSLGVLSGSFSVFDDKAALSYAASYNAVAYMVDTYGEEGLIRLLRAYGQRQPTDQAFLDALGTSYADFEAAWRRSLNAVEPTPLPTKTPFMTATPRPATPTPTPLSTAAETVTPSEAPGGIAGDTAQAVTAGDGTASQPTAQQPPAGLPGQAMPFCTAPAFGLGLLFLPGLAVMAHRRRLSRGP